MRNGSLAYDPVLIEVGVHSLYEPFIKIISMPDRIYLTLDMLPDAYPRYELAEIPVLLTVRVSGGTIGPPDLCRFGVRKVPVSTNVSGIRSLCEWV